MPDTRALVVFFSRTGNTRAVAEGVAEALHADVEALSDRMERRGMWGYLRCSVEAALRRHARLQPLTKDPGAYDLVVVGTPMWMGTLSSLVRAYLDSQRTRLPEVAFLLTHGGTPETRAFAEMAALAGKNPLATLAVREGEIVRGLHTAKIEQFVSVLRGATEGSVQEEPC